jgi:hypothetical protein
MIESPPSPSAPNPLDHNHFGRNVALYGAALIWALTVYTMAVAELTDVFSIIVLPLLCAGIFYVAVSAARKAVPSEGVGSVAFYRLPSFWAGALLGLVLMVGAALFDPQMLLGQGASADFETIVLFVLQGLIVMALAGVATARISAVFGARKEDSDARR